jgi:hypothetical protein
MNYDDWLVHMEHEYRGWNDGEFECPECGCPVEKEYQHCSGVCWEASQL